MKKILLPILLLGSFVPLYSAACSARQVELPHSTEIEVPTHLKNMLEKKGIDYRSIEKEKLALLIKQMDGKQKEKEIQKARLIAQEKKESNLKNISKFLKCVESKKNLEKYFKDSANLRCLRFFLFNIFLMIQDKKLQPLIKDFKQYKNGDLIVLNPKTIKFTPETYLKLINYYTLTKEIDQESLYSLMEKYGPLENLPKKYACNEIPEIFIFILQSLCLKSDSEAVRFLNYSSTLSNHLNQKTNPIAFNIQAFICSATMLSLDYKNFEEVKDIAELYNRLMKLPSSQEDKMFSPDDGKTFWILPDTFGNRPTRFVEKTDDFESLYKKETKNPKKKNGKKKKKTLGASAYQEKEILISSDEEETFTISSDISKQETPGISHDNPERSGSIQLKNRILDWFINPERALHTQGYIQKQENFDPFKGKLLDAYGPDKIIQNHRFPRSIDTLVLFDQAYGEIEEHKDNNCFQLVVPGYIKENSNFQLGQYEYAFRKKRDGSRVIFHRFFRPMTSENIINKFTKKDGWHEPAIIDNPLNLTQEEKEEFHTNESWQSLYEQEGWEIDIESNPYYTTFKNKDNSIEYGIQRKSL